MLPAHHRVRRAAGEREPLSAAETPGAGWAVAPTRALCRSEELPDWYEPSRHVLSGYRVGYDACACAGSVFEIHNQSLNVWTHLAGGLCFAHAAAARAAPLIRGEAASGDATRGDEWSMVVFSLAACCMLFASTAYHIFAPLSRTAARRWLKVDKCGIAVMISGSFVPGVWLGLRCDAPAARALWLVGALGLLVIGLALGVEVVPERHHNATFAAMVCSGLLPTLHFCLAVRSEVLWLFLPKLFAMFGLYGIGFAVYLSRWPEASYPGRFDVLGASHQLWHLCVLGAAAVWYADVAAFLALLEASAPVVRCAP